MRIAAVLLCFSVSLLGAEESLFRLTSDLGAFSPDSDGIQDTLIIRPLDAPENISDYIVRIESDRVVRTFRADRRQVRPSRAISNLFLPFADSVRPLELFEELLWDGRDDLGKVVPDGDYSIRVVVYDADGKQTESAPARVQVNTKKPQLAVNAVSKVIMRPFDAEGKPANRIEGEVSIAQTASAEPGTRYRAEIRDASGVLIESRDWNTSPSNSVVWNGRNSKGELALHGTYSYALIARTPSGVTARAELPGILVTPEIPTVDLKPDEAFSPNADGAKDKLQFLVSYFGSSPRGAIRAYRLEIFEAGKPESVYDSLTERPLPGVLVWDGQTRTGARAPDGIYEARLTLDTTAGEMRSARVAFRIDTKPPELIVRLGKSRFSPDGDGENELLPIEVEAADESGIEFWSLRAMSTPDTPVQVMQLLRLWQGSSLPENLMWNGNTQAQDVVESLEILTFSLEARDRAGNPARPALDTIRTSVLFRQSDGGVLVSRLPNQKYFNPDHTLSAEGRSMVSDLRSELARYRRYKVEVYAVAALPGREEENLEMTERRARSVFERVKNDRDADRILFQGLGESEVIYLSSDPFSNFRNERIEVRLNP